MLAEEIVSMVKEVFLHFSQLGSENWKVSFKDKPGLWRGRVISSFPRNVLEVQELIKPVGNDRKKEEWNQKNLGASCRHLVFWQIRSKQRWQTFRNQLNIFWIADWTKNKSVRKFLYMSGFPWNLRWGDAVWEFYL